jgi:hypothetical protein
MEIATSWQLEKCGEEVTAACIMYRDFPRCRLGVPRIGSHTTATPCCLVFSNTYKSLTIRAPAHT